MPAQRSPTLSLIVITRNEEKVIGRCLRSAHFATEVIVVDHGSDDRTVDIAAGLGARVIKTPDWPGFGQQKNRALAAASGDWVLCLDADEWIEETLAESIRAVIRKEDAADGYLIPRRSRFCGKVVRFSGWSPDYVLRLFRRDRGRFSDSLVHERVLVEGRVGKLAFPIQHDGITSMEDARAKAESYSLAGATQLRESGASGSLLKAWAHSAAAFVRTYLLKLGFLDLRTGWLVACYNASYTYNKWSKLRDMAGRDGSGSGNH